MDKLLYYIYNIKLRNDYVDNLYKRIIVRLLNIILPFYYKATSNFSDNRIVSRKNINNEDVYIVSLTSFNIRIDSVWLVIESILRQETKPDALILWLYKGEFPDKSELPEELLELQKRGLQIRFCEEDLEPHKKYYYTLLENPEANIITIDDDIIYPPDLIKRLKKFHNLYPNNIFSFIARKISIKNNEVETYKEWDIVETNKSPGKIYQQIGAGSVLYPSGSLHEEVLNRKVLKKIALKADDLWLKVMSLKNNTKVLPLSGEYNRFFVPIIFKENYKLMKKNILYGNNDKVLKNILEYYSMPTSIFTDNDKAKNESGLSEEIGSL